MVVLRPLFEKLTEFQQDKNIQYYTSLYAENSAKSGITADTRA